jgi:iron complex outermembrane receptor protein
MQSKLLLLAAAMLYATLVFSQHENSVSFKIADAGTGLPIEHAEIVFTPSAIGGVTNLKGILLIQSIDTGIYKVVVSHIAFHRLEKEIHLLAGVGNDFEFQLSKKVKVLDEFIVREEKPADIILSKVPYIETIIGKKQINKEGTRDIGDFLRSSKNINGIRKGGTQLDPVVRGFKYSQLNVQINNGHKVEGGCPNRMDPATAHVEIEDIESIEVKKGPYALRYGPSFGGIINMVTQIPPHTDDSPVHIKAMKSYESNWNGNKEHLGVYGGYKWFFYNFSGGQKSYGNYNDGNGNEVNSAFRKYNYKGQLGFQAAKHHTVSLNYEESKGRDVMFPTLPMDERSDDTQLMSADYTAKDISDAIHSLQAKLYLTDVTHVMDNKNRPYSDTVVAVSTIDALNQGGRVEMGLNISHSLLTAGLDFENIKKDGERIKTMILQPGLPVKNEKLWNKAKITNAGIFAEYLKTIQSWEIIATARLDFNSASSDSISVTHPMQGEIYHYASDSIQSDFTNFSFSVGVTKKLNPHLALSLALGRGTRSPDMTERFIILLPIGYDPFDYLGDPQLKPETNNQVDLTLKYKNEKYGMIQLNGFYSLVNNFISGKRIPPSQQKPLTNGVIGVKQFYNAGNARFRGFEFAYATPSTLKFGASLFASFTYATINKVQQYVMNAQGAVIDDVELINDALAEIPPFESTASVYYRLFKGKLVPTINVRMVAAQKHVSKATYEKESPGFTLAGFSVNYDFNKYFTVAGGVNNIFNAAYFEHLNRNIIGSTNSLYEPGRSFYINLYFKI